MLCPEPAVFRGGCPAVPTRRHAEARSDDGWAVGGVGENLCMVDDLVATGFVPQDQQAIDAWFEHPAVGRWFDWYRGGAR